MKPVTLCRRPCEFRSRGSRFLLLVLLTAVALMPAFGQAPKAQLVSKPINVTPLHIASDPAVKYFGERVDARCPPEGFVYPRLPR